MRDYEATLQLAGGSEVAVRSWPNGPHGTEAELVQGTLTFHSSGPVALEIVADKACIRPASEVKTLGRVSIIGPRELAINAYRGPLQFSYRGETETLAEGKSYRVILDPPDDVPNQKNPQPPKQLPKGFKIAISGEGAAIAGLGIYELVEPESPDRPGEEMSLRMPR